MATKTTAERINNEVKIGARTGSRLKGVFAGIGTRAGISLTGGGTKTGGTGGRGSGSVVIIKGGGADGTDEVAVDRMLDEVRPGDLITSDFMVRLLERINQLEAAVLKLAGGGEVTVPDLFGRSLSKVIASVQKSDGALAIGLILDVLGTEVNPAEPGTRVVLGQQPPAGNEVDEGTEIDLLVSLVQRVDSPPVGGGINLSDSAPGGPAAGATADGELERVTDDDAAAAAGTKSAPRGASKSRRSPTK